jgi:hypothetical protein
MTVLSKERGWLTSRFVVRHGFFPVGIQGLELAADEFLREAGPLVDTAESFWASVQEHFDNFKRRFERMPLEIRSPSTC